MYNVTMPVVNFRANGGKTAKTAKTALSQLGQNYDGLKKELDQLKKEKNVLEQKYLKAKTEWRELVDMIGPGYGSRADHYEELRLNHYIDGILRDIKKIEERINEINKNLLNN